MCKGVEKKSGSDQPTRSKTESAAQLGITSRPTQLPCKVTVVVGATLHHPPGDSFL